MNKTKALIILCLVTISLFAQQKPDIILIYVDDMGYGDLSSYGSEFKTPNIDKIGKDGIRFTNFYVAAPVCTPSRFSLLTGTYPQRSKHNLTFALMPDNKNYLDINEKIIPHYLKNAGYQTNMIGKWHLGRIDSLTTPVNYGFDDYTGTMGGCIDYFTHSYGKMTPDWYVHNKLVAEKGYATDLMTDHAIRYIKQAQKKTQPYFLYLAYNAPHYGKTDPGILGDFTLSLGSTAYKGLNDLNTLQAPPKYLKKVQYIKDPYRRTYAAMVLALDDAIGRLLNHLKKTSRDKNTMIWFISDNGGYGQSQYAHASNGELKGEKGQLWEGGIRVPAMVSWPAQIKPGQIVQTPLCNVDLLPTFTALVHAETPIRTDGKDISNVLLHNEPLERNLYWNFGNQTAFRSGDWKLVNEKELYNLKNDKTEKHNLASEQPVILQKMQDLFKQEQLRINSNK